MPESIYWRYKWDDRAKETTLDDLVLRLKCALYVNPRYFSFYNIYGQYSWVMWLETDACLHWIHFKADRYSTSEEIEQYCSPFLNQLGERAKCLISF